MAQTESIPYDDDIAAHGKIVDQLTEALKNATDPTRQETISKALKMAQANLQRAMMLNMPKGF